jgi:hypothetical protein
VVPVEQLFLMSQVAVEQVGMQRMAVQVRQEMVFYCLVLGVVVQVAKTILVV